MIISFYSGPEITKTFLADVAQPGGKFSILPTLRPLTSMKSLLFFYRARPPPPGVLEFENGPFSVREFVKTISFGVREKTKYHERYRGSLYGPSQLRAASCSTSYPASTRAGSIRRAEKYKRLYEGKWHLARQDVVLSTICS